MNAEILGLAAAIVGARLAGELALRLRQPVVLAEIAAGIVLGPHALGLIDPHEGLHFVAELGAILLLLEVGLHLDLRELRNVGGSAARVALIGMLAPAALVYPVAVLFGEPSDVALFLAAGMTATSVGVTARVFQELRVLDTPEARTVLGAAVIDDVAGLLVLAVAVPLSTGAALSAAGIALTAATAIGFVVGATVLSLLLVPRLLSLAARARGDGATGVTSAAVGFGLAGAAGVAGLAPIVGAFVGGLAIATSSEADEARRSLLSLSRILVPTFFLVIGTEVDLAVAADPAVLAAAAALTVAGLIGKLAAGAGASARAGDKIVIGLGMVPRGEVGLIFAGIGLAEAILPEDAHATLVLAVMATTIVAPPLLRMRAESPAGTAAAAEPIAQGALLDILRDGDRTAWRLFSQRAPLADVIGPAAGPVLERLADPLTDAHPVRLLDDLRRVVGNPYDPAAVVWGRSADHDLLRVAALAQDTLSGPDAPEQAAMIAAHAGLSPADVSEVANLVRDRTLLPAAAGRHDATEERVVLELASHIGEATRADRLYLLAAATLRGSSGDRARLDALFRLIRAALEHPELTSREATTLLARRRDAVAGALSSLPADVVARHLDHAPRSYLLAHEAGAIARHITMATLRPGRREIRLEAEPKAGAAWTVHVVAADRGGLLAAIAGAIARIGATVLSAQISTWPDGLAVDVFTVVADGEVDWEAVRRDAAEAPLGRPDPPRGARLRIDDDASPWYTLVEIEAPDGVGLLHRTATVFARAGVTVHGAQITTRDGRAVDRFEVTASDGGKLSPRQAAALIEAFEGRGARANEPVTDL